MQNNIIILALMTLLALPATAQIDLQYQQSRKKGGKDDEPTPEPETEEAI